MQDYSKLPLLKQALQQDPFQQFSLWFNQALSQGEIEPSAFTLATVNTDYDVTARIVLLKSFDEKGFVFFTNYLSAKSEQLKEIPKAAMVFWWPKCQRQVRICGLVNKIPATQSDEYFKKRPRESQIAATISQQSQPLTDREQLLQEFNSFTNDTQQPIRRPDFWGGFILNPEKIEFWQARSHRLHDRFQYTKNKASLWEILQLYP
ncbi:MAG: pyridoxamine 5'-phosphate oxidase [Proteobacteria bacterium]|nr:pyridoxamine 5'-phosphate oxidase [Pseudomonadota bacterium]